MSITFTQEELERLINALDYAHENMDTDMALVFEYGKEHDEENKKLGELLERIKQEAKV